MERRQHSPATETQSQLEKSGLFSRFSSKPLDKRAEIDDNTYVGLRGARTSERTKQEMLLAQALKRKVPT